MIKIYLFWMLGRQDQALEMFSACLQRDRSAALELFEIYPDLKNAEELVHLSDN